MALESATYISDLVSTNPTSSDNLSQGDDHIRLLKATLKSTFPNVSGAVTATHTELNYVDGVTSAIQTQLDSKATNGTSAVHTAGSIELGASDTTITRSAAGLIAVEGKTVPLESRANTFSESQTISKTSGDVGLLLSSASGAYKSVAYLTGSNYRFDFGIDNQAETGSNAGSNFYISRFNDAGSYISTPLAIERSTGVTFLENLNVTSSAYAPTAAAYTNTTQVATTAQVYSTVSQALIRYVTGNFTLSAVNRGETLMMAGGYTITIPPDSTYSFPTGTRIDIVQWDAGQTTIASSSPVFLGSKGGKVKLAGQYSGATLIKMGSNSWSLIGDLA